MKCKNCGDNIKVSLWRRFKLFLSNIPYYFLWFKPVKRLFLERFFVCNDCDEVML